MSKYDEEENDTEDNNDEDDDEEYDDNDENADDDDRVGYLGQCDLKQHCQDGLCDQRQQEASKPLKDLFQYYTSILAGGQ